VSARLLSDRNWRLPRRLGWLPDLRVEGTHAPESLVATEETTGRRDAVSVVG
jgi:hypothetical protein